MVAGDAISVACLNVFRARCVITDLVVVESRMFHNPIFFGRIFSVLFFRFHEVEVFSSIDEARHRAHRTLSNCCFFVELLFLSTLMIWRVTPNERSTVIAKIIRNNRRLWKFLQMAVKQWRLLMLLLRTVKQRKLLMFLLTTEFCCF